MITILMKSEESNRYKVTANYSLAKSIVHRFSDCCLLQSSGNLYKNENDCKVIIQLYNNTNYVRLHKVMIYNIGIHIGKSKIRVK